jgi:hypothetical protein
MRVPVFVFSSENFFSSFKRLPCVSAISTSSDAATASSELSYYPDCEFDIKMRVVLHCAALP